MSYIAQQCVLLILVLELAPNTHIEILIPLEDIELDSFTPHWFLKEQKKINFWQS